MAINIEIKAVVSDKVALLSRIARISDDPGHKISQRDIFFHCPEGRLKLRYLSRSHGHLIYYERNDTPIPEPSYYQIMETDQPDQLREILASAYGIRGEVKKERMLYMCGNTRIHVDEVENLGCYLELEVVLKSDESEQYGEEIAAGLMSDLAIGKESLIDKAYIDLIEEQATHQPRSHD